MYRSALKDPPSTQTKLVGASNEMPPQTIIDSPLRFTRRTNVQGAYRLLGLLQTSCRPLEEYRANLDLSVNSTVTHCRISQVRRIRGNYSLPVR